MATGRPEYGKEPPVCLRLAPYLSQSQEFRRELVLRRIAGVILRVDSPVRNDRQALNVLYQKSQKDNRAEYSLCVRLAACLSIHHMRVLCVKTLDRVEDFGHVLLDGLKFPKAVIKLPTRKNEHTGGMHIKK